MGLPEGQVDLKRPKYDQSTYMGRLKHFFLLTNPLNLLASSSELDKAKRVCDDYVAGQPVEDVKDVDELWHYKYLKDSAFHPDTGEKVLLIGRMSAQVPMNTLITGCMLVFYKTTPAVLFWQWANQTFNAIVNYSNRSGATPISTNQLVTSYVLATSGAVATALSLNRLTRKMNPLFGRLVPLAAVAAANCINIPLMRSEEIMNGVEVVDENDTILGKSRNAAIQGISAVVASRCAMAAPGMSISPIVVQALTNRCFFHKYPRLSAPIQMALVGSVLIVATPMGCAFFDQRAAYPVDKLEPELREKIKNESPERTTVWFNKGL